MTPRQPSSSPPPSTTSSGQSKSGTPLSGVQSERSTFVSSADGASFSRSLAPRYSPTASSANSAAATTPSVHSSSTMSDRLPDTATMVAVTITVVSESQPIDLTDQTG